MEPALLETKDANTIEIRDPEGTLVSLIVLIPGRPVFIASSADKDPDFEAFAKNMGFKIKQ